MEWPYHFVTLTDEEVAYRRIILDRYGIYAQLSALVPVLVYQLYRLGLCVSSERLRAASGYAQVPEAPGSPVRKKNRLSSTRALGRHWRSLLWWLEGEVFVGWGLRRYWIAAILWASWLLFLAVHKTGDGMCISSYRFINSKSSSGVYSRIFMVQTPVFNQCQHMSWYITNVFYGK